MIEKVTIYDIAKKLDITAATVSRALNNNPNISESTRELVLNTAQKMNYEQNKLALALKSGKSNNVGVIVPRIDSNFFGNISISNNSVYDYNLTYTGPVNGSIRVNALTSESLISLPVGIYAFERTPINSPNPTTIQNNITVNCGLETMFNFN